MKKIIAFVLMVWSLSSGFGQNYYMATPEGFGAATTGGGSATPVIVTTLADLRAKLKLGTPQVIIVSGTINIPDGQYITEVVSNKTLLGFPGTRLVNTSLSQTGSGVLNLKPGSNNVIIRNLIFEGPGAYDTNGRDNLTADGCTNLWVDHCEFQDAIDGNFDIKGLSDNITVSWCKFTYLKPAIPGGPGGSADHRFSNLIGSSSTDAPADNRYSVTFLNNYWADGVKARMPRARNAELHMANCYYFTNVAGSIALGLGGGSKGLTCYVENTHFAKVGTVFKNETGDGGTVAVNFDNCIGGVANLGTVTKPTYNYTLLAVADVETFVTHPSCGAGATLQVTAEGVISSSCGSLSVRNELLALGIKTYPSSVDDLLTIDFSDKVAGEVRITIYSLTGQQVLGLTKKVSLHEKVPLNMEQLSPGMYFGTLSTKEGTAAWKFIKK